MGGLAAVERGAEHGARRGDGRRGVEHVCKILGGGSGPADHGRGPRRRRQDDARRRLAAALRARGRPVLVLREPGGVELSERIRALRASTRRCTSRRAPRRCCSRPPARSSSRSSCGRCSTRGEWVLLDRFVDSSLAYQGAGRGLGIDGGARAQRLRAPAACVPDRTLLLRIDAGRGARAARPAARTPTGSSASGRGFFSAIAGAYDALAAAEPERFAVLDAVARRRTPCWPTRSPRVEPLL